MTNGEIVNRIINTLNSVSKDDRISKRYVLNVARGKASFYISQKLRDRSLYREDNLYTTLECVALTNDDLKRCDIVEFRKCKSVMKSKKKLPELIYSRYGSSLKEVLTLDSEKDFKYTTPAQYRRDKNRAGKSPYTYYYIKDGYLYLIDSHVERVDLYLLTLEQEKLEDCSECKQKSCKSLWDYEFIIPSKLSEVVYNETLNEILNEKKIPKDENPNLNENIK